jgi:hypothetical protein
VDSNTQASFRRCLPVSYTAPAFGSVADEVDISLSRDITERFKEKERSQGRHSDSELNAAFLPWKEADFQSISISRFSPVTIGHSGDRLLITLYQPRLRECTIDSTSSTERSTSEFTLSCLSPSLVSGPLPERLLINSGRKLQWLWHMQRCEFRTNYLSQKLIFMTNAFQMAILLQFNESDSITLQDLHTATSIPEQTLRNHLLPMVKMKVLIQDGDTFDLNLSTSYS